MTVSRLAGPRTELLTLAREGQARTSRSRTDETQQAFKDVFSELAGDEAKFHAFMKEVYGPNYDRQVAEGLRQRSLEGDFDWLPKVEYVDGADLGGANGAYDAASGTVFLSRDIDPETAAQTFIEEAAHHIDTLVNDADTAGDEGEMFRRLIGGEKLTEAQKAEIRAENDKGTITVNGKTIEVEFWNPFKAIGKAVKGAAKAVGNAFKSAGKAIGSAVKGIGKAIGSVFTGVFEGVTGFFGNLFKGRFGAAFGALWNGIDKAIFRSAGQLLNGFYSAAEHLVDAATHVLPFGSKIRKVTDRIMDAGRSVVMGVFNTARGVVNNLAEATGTFLKGVGKLATGDIKGGFKDMASGVFKGVIQTPADALLMLLGKGVSAIQTILFLEPAGRELTAAEIAELRKVYGDSIDYDQVRIKEGFSGLFSINDRAFVHGNTVYMKDLDPSDPDWMDTLVHEMGHVWQHQNGGTDYMTEALWSQEKGHGYDWESSVPGTAWEDLEPEQQAELIEAAYLAGYFDTGSFIHPDTGADLSAYMDRVAEMIRDGEGAP